MSESVVNIIIQLTVWVPLTVLTVFLPLLRRHPVSFGIALPVDKLKAPEVLRIRNRYMIICAVIGAAGLVFSLLSSDRQGETSSLNAAVTVFLPLGYLFISMLLYVLANRQTAKLKAERGWQLPDPRFVVVDTAFRRDSGAISLWWYLIPLGLILLEVGMLAAAYDRLPDILNVHYNGNTVDRTEPKSVKTVFFPSLIQLFMVILLAVISQMIKGSKQGLNPADPEGSLERSRKLRRTGTWMMWGVSLLATIEFGLVQFGIVGWLDSRAVTAIAVVSPLVFIGFSMALAARMMVLTEPQAMSGTPVNDDRYWKAGLFYYNPSDPAVFVEKRVGIGWTVNLGRPLGWLVLASPLLFILIILLLAAL